MRNQGSEWLAEVEIVAESEKGAQIQGLLDVEQHN